ncbi:MAG TPA: hypothetical protein VN631_10130 [Negativicutes bacterium]|nr:hypothetical protein [Negativicutes bacterium]
MIANGKITSGNGGIMIAIGKDIAMIGTGGKNILESGPIGIAGTETMMMRTTFSFTFWATVSVLISTLTTDTRYLAT